MPEIFSPKMFEDVAAFHEKFGLEQENTKTLVGALFGISEEEWKLRHDRLQEELDEYWDAVNAGNDVETLDALVDLVYIALGTAYRRGWDFNEAWRRVHEANMAKERGKPSTSKYNSGFDIVKPEGWQPPNLNDLV